MIKNDRFQYGIGRLIVLTSVVAIAMTISVRINVPRLTQGLFAVYLALLAGWAVMRGPTVVSGLMAVNVKRRKLLEHRAKLERELCHRKSVDKPNDRQSQ